MSEELKCHRCGVSLAALSLPWSRRDECPGCRASLYVCRMCRFFDPLVPKQCREDDAEEVQDKDKVNFCEWFKPSPHAFDPARAQRAARAEAELANLFGEGEPAQAAAGDPLAEKAEDLFR